MKTIYLILICISALFFQSCSSCKNIPAYGGNARMIYGHSDETKMSGTKNPYKVKAKKPKKSKNRYSTKGWRSW